MKNEKWNALCRATMVCMEEQQLSTQFMEAGQEGWWRVLQPSIRICSTEEKGVAAAAQAVAIVPGRVTAWTMPLTCFSILRLLPLQQVPMPSTMEHPCLLLLPLPCNQVWFLLLFFHCHSHSSLINGALTSLTVCFAVPQAWPCPFKLQFLIARDSSQTSYVKTSQLLLEVSRHHHHHHHHHHQPLPWPWCSVSHTPTLSLTQCKVHRWHLGFSSIIRSPP